MKNSDGVNNNNNNNNNNNDNNNNLQTQTGRLISPRRPDLVIVTKKKEKLLRSASRPQSKIKKSEKRDKYLDLARKQKPMDHKGDDVLIVIGALGTMPKWLIKELEDLDINRQVETIQTTLFWLARILWRVLEMWGDSSEMPLANAGVKIYQKSKNDGWLCVMAYPSL